MIKIRIVFTDRHGRVTGDDEYHAPIVPARCDELIWKGETWGVCEVAHILKDSPMMGGMSLKEVVVRVSK